MQLKTMTICAAAVMVVYVVFVRDAGVYDQADTAQIVPCAVANQVYARWRDMISSALFPWATLDDEQLEALAAMPLNLLDESHSTTTPAAAALQLEEVRQTLERVALWQELPERIRRRIPDFDAVAVWRDGRKPGTTYTWVSYVTSHVGGVEQLLRLIWWLTLLSLLACAVAWQQYHARRISQPIERTTPLPELRMPPLRHRWSSLPHPSFQ